MILALTTIWPVITGVVLSVVVIYILFVLYFTQRSRDKNNREILKRIDGRIWDIPVSLQCQMCKDNIDLDFSLETNHFNCPKCGGYNKVMVQFITVATEESWKPKK
jgi:hypothetical protein